MKKIFLSLLFLFVCGLAEAQSPWVYGNAVWRYCFIDLVNPDFGEYRVVKTGEVQRNGILCDQLVPKIFHYSNSIPYDSLILDTIYTYKSFTGDTIFYEQGGEFRTLYDFSGASDSLFIHYTTTGSGCLDSSYTYLHAFGTVNIQGVDYRTCGTSSPTSHIGKYELGLTFAGGLYNERFGQYSNADTHASLFPKENSACVFGSPSYRLLCFSDDSLIYDHDCDYFESADLMENFLNLKIYPNPTSEYVKIIGLVGTVNVQLHSMSGQLVLSEKIESPHTISVEYLDKGIYIMNVKDLLGNELNQRIIKM